MSSEMRKISEAWKLAAKQFSELGSDIGMAEAAVYSNCAKEIDALIARTEAGADVTEVVRTAPERIWLQVADDTYYAAEPFPLPASDQITWCQDSVMAVEVPYVRADLATRPQDASGDEVAELIAAADVLNTGAKLGLSTYPEDWKRLDAALAAMQAKEAK